MAPTGFGELAVTLLFVAVIWLAGAVYIKVADYYMQRGRAADPRADRGSPSRHRNPTAFRIQR